ARPQARGVLFGADLHLRVREQDVEHLANGVRAPASDVVRLAGFRALEREPVRANDVANVGEVALRREVAVLDYRREDPSLDLRDLLREGAVGEDSAAARSG